MLLQILFLSPSSFHDLFFFFFLPVNPDYWCVPWSICELFKHKQFHSRGDVNNLTKSNHHKLKEKKNPVVSQTFSRDWGRISSARYLPSRVQHFNFPWKKPVLLLSHEGYLLSLEILTGRTSPPVAKLSLFLFLTLHLYLIPHTAHGDCLLIIHP